jgi:hypothetical protein
MHDTPQLNGVAEWLNRTLLERICAFAHMSSLPKTLWGEGLRHATWLKNRTATHVLDGKMPFEALFGVPPNLSGLRLWRCPIWVHNTAGSKLDVWACQGCWIRLDADMWAHRIYWPGNGNVTVERNIYFGSSAQLEGERMQVPSENGKSTAAPTTPPTPKPPAIPKPPTTPRTPARACMLPPGYAGELPQLGDHCDCAPEWHCDPHNAYFIYDLCFCDGSGS